MVEQRLNRRKLRVFAAPVLSTFLVALLALLAPQRSSGEVGAGAVAFECQHRCKGQNIASSSCPLWCRQASLRAPSSSSSSSSSSLSSSSSFPLSSSSSRVGSSRGDRQRDHSKRHAVDTEDDDGGWKKRSSSVGPPPPPPIAHGAAAPAAAPVLRVTADVRQTKRSTLDAVVAWSWWPTDPPGAGAGAGAGGRGRGPPLGPPFGEFVLHWARDTCNFDHRFPYCDDPDVYLSKTFRSQNNFTIANLTYNSKYWAEVEYEGLVSTRVTFTTPGCSKPSDHTFKRCLATSIVTVTTAGPAEDHSLRVNVTCRHLDAQMQVIRAILRWKLPAEESGNWTTWESTVLVQHTTTEGVHMEVQRTNSAEIAVTLAPERLYEIMVKASMKTKDIIYHTLYLNTSRDLSSSSSSNSSGSSQTKATPDDCLTTTIPKPDKLKTQTTEAPWNPLLLAMAVLAVVVMTTVALVCINRCRGFQSKLLKKTLLSKSNNYKTTPGTPRLPKDEQLQMILKTDDWELDARDVTLGAEVGQGAFGLVMTGYYQNVQVAIKVLKGDVLPSYREELLREITLMKRIGKHPNIVSLIGACTVRDPIALIMEYMPFGNLQSFLQKCRLEGGLRRKETGTEVEYSPLDELNGTKEFWILSSTDMLSFARQVAVAMEFLTDRKYVHRDLAARNVLVGQNKVVKLCDFGLARLVYNGDQYCKLTNGRLPLKWMAVESIRDRVFTAQSDVWSYGVLLWEIATLGCSPYPNIALVDLFSLLTEGYRMEQPKSCSAELYDIMSQCWHESASNRPTFAGIRVQLDSMLSQRRNYLDLDCLLPSPAAAAAAARPRSPADAPYSFPASSVDLPGAEHLSRQNRRHLVETGNVAGGNVTSGGDRRWNSQQDEEEEEEEEEEDEEEEEEESDYLQSSEIVTSVAAQKQDENRRQERGAGAGGGEEEAFANLL